MVSVGNNKLLVGLFRGKASTVLVNRNSRSMLVIDA